MKILGISAYYHDSSAAIIVDGVVVVAIQEERLSRIKHDSSFPTKACKFCMDYAKLSPQDIDEVVFYEKPLLRFERILECLICFAPKTLLQFVKIMPIWLRDKLNMRSLLKKELKKEFNEWSAPILFTEHHLSHAASAYYSSPFNESAILVIDAVGEWATTSLMVGRKNKITLLKEQLFPDSIGLLYSSFTYFLGFKVNSDEYKLMGLSPYGIKNDPETQNFIRQIKEHIVTIDDDGFIKLNLKYFSYHCGFNMINEKTWFELFGMRRRIEGEEIKQSHCNLAFAIQSITEEICLNLANHIKHITGCNNLCISGGTALNCVMNGVLKNSDLFDDIFVPYSPGDGGGSIGAALASYYLSKPNALRAENRNPYLGPQFSNDEILKIIVRNGLSYEYYENDILCKKIAEKISKGNIIGWFQGRTEFGPRALGNRSIIADCRTANMKDRINASIKFREGFRPFAPVVLYEYKTTLFNMDYESPYMMFTTTVIDEIRNDFHRDKSFNININPSLSNISAVTHIDYSSRTQTLKKIDNPLFYDLLTEYYSITGCPAVLNTSFNIMGEPIVCSPQDAINTFLKSGIEILVVGNYVIQK